MARTVLILLAGCRPAAPSTPAASRQEIDQAAIYAAVVRRLYTKDNT